MKRANSYSKEAVYIICGVKDDNTRELFLQLLGLVQGSLLLWGSKTLFLPNKGMPCLNCSKVFAFIASNLCLFIMPKVKFSLDKV
ncbi:MAG: hypothetical protein AAF770_00135 [Bacteroidota bacterium]